MANDNFQRKDTPKSDESRIELPVTFTQLAGGKTELAIEHEGQVYRLKATKNGKLLLNK